MSTINSARVVQRFPAASLNALPPTGPSPATNFYISGISDVAALAVHPSNPNVVLVADGTTHQVKCFGSAGGVSALWTLGDAGGQPGAANPTVSNTRFWFRQETLDGNTWGSKTFLAIQSGGSFWLGDRGNSRILHFRTANYLFADGHVKALRPTATVANGYSMWGKWRNAGCTLPNNEAINCNGVSPEAVQAFAKLEDKYK